MTGAAILAGRAALLMGAGRVFLGLPEGVPGDFDTVQPELMLRDGAQIFAAPLTALACGPGLGDGPEAVALLESSIATVLPLVIDADGINRLAANEELRVAVASRRAVTILTPHPTEAARLLDAETGAIQADRVDAARELATELRAFVILKGCGTIIASPEGRWWVNASGNPGLATAGSGDVLTGMIASLLAQGWPPEAACLGASHLHGRAAEEVADALGGEVGIVASEIAGSARRILNRWIAEASAGR